MPERYSWSRQFRYRKEYERRYRSVFSIPIARRPSEVLLRHLRDGMRVLDLGAGVGKVRERIRSRFPHAEVRSLDVDPETSPDYRAIDEVADASFDVVVLFEVLEHLDVDAGLAILTGIRRVLVEGGRLVASTPNVFHPSAFFRDATHRTPLAYDELAGLVTSCGFQVIEIRRIHNAPWGAKVLRRAFAAPLHYLLGVDWARSVVVVASR